jgi:ribonuclease BN (tRNA processing enzyme)
MELLVLGSGTCTPSLNRAAPGLLIWAGGKRILCDSGSGTLERLLKAKVTYNDIDLLCYTHKHPDHTADLVPFLFACKYGDPPRKKDLILIGGRGFKQFLSELKAVYNPWVEAQHYRLCIYEMETDQLDLQGFSLRTKPMKHTPQSVGYRLKDKTGRSITVSGDTDYCPDIIELARESSLLVLESSFPDQHRVEGHLTPALAGRIAHEARCPKLLLTHFYPICDRYDILAECRANYKGEIILAQDGMRIAI